MSNQGVHWTMPPNTKPYQITYKGSVTPKKTKYLESEALSMDFDGTIELDATDGANIKNVQKEFQSKMEAQIKGQLAALDKWLAEKDAVIADLMKRTADLQKAPFPSGPKLAQDRLKTLLDLKAIADQIEDYKEDFKTIVADWASNCKEQQAKVAMVLATKAARVKSFDGKSFRVRAGQVVKGVLVIAAIVVSVAAIIVTAGTTAPLFIGLASAGAAIGGGASLIQLGKNIKDNYSMEERILASAKTDVESVEDAFGKVREKGTKIAKHVTDLTNLMKIRDDNIRALENEIQSKKAAAKGYRTDIGKIKPDPLTPASEITSRTKAADELETKVGEAETKIKALKADNAKAADMLKGLTDLGVQVGKLSGQEVGSIGKSLAARFGDLDKVTDLVGAVGGIVNNAAGIHT